MHRYEDPSPYQRSLYPKMALFVRDVAAKQTVVRYKEVAAHWPSRMDA